VSPAKFILLQPTRLPLQLESMIKDRPHRLDLIYVDQPVYFVTFATRDRKPIPSLHRAQLALEKYGDCATSTFNVALGRYVIMPDHVHLFVRGDADFRLSSWVGGLKRTISAALLKEAQATRLPLQGRSFWQPGFFDHILRCDESYAEKWNYVRDNPVRAGLVGTADEWPYQGEIVVIDRA
jgi:putative transposase